MAQLDDETFYRRQGFWLRMARERAGKSQAGAAQEIGLAAKSKSTISDYERGEQQAPQQVLRTLARWYQVPVDLFTSPGLTAEEMIQARMDELERRAADAERADWNAGEGRGPSSGGGNGAALRKRTA